MMHLTLGGRPLKTSALWRGKNSFHFAVGWNIKNGGCKHSEKSAGVFYGWSRISNLGHSPQAQIFECKKAICRKGTLELYLRAFL